MGIEIQDIPAGFRNIKCRNHPDRDIVPPAADRFCQECHDKAWNQGARLADDQPRHSYQIRTEYNVGDQTESFVETWKE